MNSRISVNLDKDVVIGTHNGAFHADDVFACAMLQLLPEYRNSKILRTRNLEDLEKCRIVVDVGGVYDASTNRYDHHFKDFNETFSSRTPLVLLSAAGLVYRHFGRQLIKQNYGRDGSDELVETLYNRFYDVFVAPIDAVDNGIDQGDNMKYMTGTDISSRIAMYNPPWTQESVSSNGCFFEAIKYMKKEIILYLTMLRHSWYPARLVVRNALENRYSIDRSGTIMVMDKWCPFETHLYKLEEELNIPSNDLIKFVLFQQKNGSYSAKTVRQSEYTFKQRTRFNESLCGLSGNELDSLLENKGALFVHSNGFFASHTTLNGIIELCRYAS